MRSVWARATAAPWSVCLFLGLTGTLWGQTESLGEDFTGDWGVFFTTLDNAGSGENPLTPTGNVHNRTMGPWGGYYPVAGATQGGVFLGDDALPGLILPQGSFFGVNNPATVGNGFLIFGAYPAAGGSGDDETGGYVYTAFPSTPIDLSGNGRVQFDAFNGTTNPTGEIHLRLLLRIRQGGIPIWIQSEPVSIEGAIQADVDNLPASGSIFSDGPIVDVEPAALTWAEVVSPEDSNLVALAPDDEGPLVIGAPVPTPDLSEVTGFGIVMASDIARGDAYGVGIDAIRLLAPVTTVQCFPLYR